MYIFKLRYMRLTDLVNVPDLELLAPPDTLLGRLPTPAEAKDWLSRIGAEVHHVVVAADTDGKNYPYWVYGMNTVEATIAKIYQDKVRAVRIFDLTWNGRDQYIIRLDDKRPRIPPVDYDLESILGPPEAWYEDKDE